MTVVLDTAVASRAAAIVTGDRDLPDLGSYRDIAIMPVFSSTKTIGG